MVWCICPTLAWISESVTSDVGVLNSQPFTNSRLHCIIIVGSMMQKVLYLWSNICASTCASVTAIRDVSATRAIIIMPVCMVQSDYYITIHLYQLAGKVKRGKMFRSCKPIHTSNFFRVISLCNCRWTSTYPVNDTWLTDSGVIYCTLF